MKEWFGQSLDFEVLPVRRGTVLHSGVLALDASDLYE